MSAPRWRNVRFAGVEWLLFDDALVRLDQVDAVRSVDPESDLENDDRGLVELAGARLLHVQFIPRNGTDDLDPEVRLGFRIQGDPPVVSFADGGALAREVTAMIRDGDLATVWFEVDAPPWTYKARPYPWAGA